MSHLYIIICIIFIFHGFNTFKFKVFQSEKTIQSYFRHNILCDFTSHPTSTIQLNPLFSLKKNPYPHKRGALIRLRTRTWKSHKILTEASSLYTWFSINRTTCLTTQVYSANLRMWFKNLASILHITCPIHLFMKLQLSIKASTWRNRESWACKDSISSVDRIPILSITSSQYIASKCSKECSNTLAKAWPQESEALNWNRWEAADASQGH